MKQHTTTNARTIMVQGTASSSGKSLMAAALCRILHQDGYRVAPFKAQNMSNNSYVTHDGLEMGRAQVVQAYAGGLEPDVRMNPVLLKPSSDTGSQVVLRGKAAFTLDAHRWHETRETLRRVVRECYESLSSEYDIVVIEGAGSPAEINLKKNDIVNMGMAKMAGSPVIIVGDIDRGGVFASLVGTMQLLDEDERALVKGFVINKFRGDVRLLQPGLDQLEELTGVPVLGVVPWMDHRVDDEDGVSQWFGTTRGSKARDIDICIVRLPHIANFTDFLPLEAVPGVGVRWCDRESGIGTPDLLIIPGTKATIADLRRLKQAGIADAIRRYARRGGAVLGVCGGFQMLGRCIDDPAHAESTTAREEGLGLLDMTTTFYAEKKTVQTTAVVAGTGSWLFTEADGTEVAGYEIHMGRGEYGSGTRPVTVSGDGRGGAHVSGVADPTGRVLGTYVHGLFDTGSLTLALVNALRERKGLPSLDCPVVDRRLELHGELNRVADVVRSALDIQAVYRIIGGGQAMP